MKPCVGRVVWGLVWIAVEVFGFVTLGIGELIRLQPRTIGVTQVAVVLSLVLGLMHV